MFDSLNSKFYLVYSTDYTWTKHVNLLWIEHKAVQKFFSIYFTSSFLRLMCSWHWTGDQSGINQASWYKLIFKLNVTLLQHRPRCTLILSQGKRSFSTVTFMLSEWMHLVYAMYIPGILQPGIYHVNTWYIPCIWLCGWYIAGMYLVYTWHIADRCLC